MTKLIQFLDKGAYTHAEISIGDRTVSTFRSNLRESFRDDLKDRTREALKKFFEADSKRQRDRFAVVDAYERNEAQRRAYRNGYYERDFVTVLGTLRLRIAQQQAK